MFCVVARDPNSKQIWHTIGGTDLYSVAEAREAARQAIKAIKTGGSRDGVETFEDIAGQWVRRHVEKNGLISAPDIKSYLGRVLVPAWGGREFVSIKRSEVAKLMDEVEAPAASLLPTTFCRLSVASAIGTPSATTTTQVRW